MNTGKELDTLKKNMSEINGSIPYSDFEKSGISIKDLKEESEQNSTPISAFDYLRITDSTEIPPPVPRITINNEIISTEGNITTLSGASKSGKSALSGILLAGAISQDGNIDGLESVRVEPNKYKKAVIGIDTEQSKHKHQCNLVATLRRDGLINCPDYFLSYNIRELDLNRYADVTGSICAAANEQFGGIHLIVIDGIADYISDVNDPVQSNAIVKYFEELAIKYSTPIIFIVHTNPGSDKERGHLGSQCQRKSESVITVKSEGDISYIEPKFLRMAGKGSIPLIQFMYDKSKGYHVGCGIRQDDQSGKDAARVSGIKKICSDVFGAQISYSYKDAIESIMNKTNKGIITAKGIFTDMKAHRLIVQGEDKNWRIGDVIN